MTAQNDVLDVLRAVPWWIFWPLMFAVSLLAWWRLFDSIREIRDARLSRSGRGARAGGRRTT